MIPGSPKKAALTLLQIFRGWAAVFVVLVHLTAITTYHFSTRFLGNYFNCGAAGVDFFFVLSGFLICYIHAGDIGQPWRVRPYLVKRLVRIYPIYWIVTLAILPTFVLVPTYGLGDETRPGVIASSLLLFPNGRGPILVAGWTLRYEILFYLIFAALIGLRSRWTWRIVSLWVAGVAASALVAFHTPRKFFGPLDELLFWPQNLEFVLGCGAAFLTHELVAVSASRRWWTMLLVLGLTAFGLAGLLPPAFFDLRTGAHVAIYGATTFVIVVAAAMIDRLGGPGARVTHHPVYRSMCFLGDASYSLYLVHGPCLSVAFKIASSRGVIGKIGTSSTAWLVLVLTVLVGCACHVTIERPLLTWLRRATLPGKTPAIAASQSGVE